MKLIKKLSLILAITGLVLAGVGIFLLTHTQVIVGTIQSFVYSDKSPNTFDSLYPPMSQLKENGQYLISEIAYSDQYPNSYLDIVYPDQQLEADRPTVFYFHGGGFFAGSKNMGDPLAASPATYLLDDLVSQGYNLVNVDYALVPDYLFPTPLIQMNLALQFLKDHAQEYHLNMDRVILMGSSAGAIMVSQYGSLLANEDYAALLEIDPVLSPDQVKALVIDDAPLDYQGLSLGAKVLIGNYVDGTIFLDKNQVNQYNPIPYVTSLYPKTFLLGSEYRRDMVLLSQALNKAGVENQLMDPLAQEGVEKPHGYVSNLRTDPVAAKAFEKMIAFMNRLSKE